MPRAVSVIEMFNGAGHLCTSAWNHGFGALGFEVLEDNVHQDMTSALGFIEALLMMLRADFQCFVHWDTCCSNWVWMSRSKTGRSKDTPMGNVVYGNVAVANLMVSRMCLLQLVAFSRFGIMLLEQPASSIMPLHRRMAQSPFKDMWKVFLHMGSYGAKSAKPTWLYGSELLIMLPLRRPMTPEQKLALDNSHIVSVEYESSGKMAVTGKTGHGGLKSSQEYTPEYAEAALSSYENWRKSHAPDIQDLLVAASSDSDYSDGEDAWDDCELEPCTRMFSDSSAQAF